MSENIPFRRQMSFEFMPWLHLRGKQTKELSQRPEDDRRIDLMTGWIEVSGTDTVKAATPPVFFFSSPSDFSTNAVVWLRTISRASVFLFQQHCAPVQVIIPAFAGAPPRPLPAFSLCRGLRKKFRAPVLQCKLPGEAMTEVSEINYNTCGAHQKNDGQQATWAKKKK